MNDHSKIYTKTGDLGETSLLGGTRVQKNHDRIEVYGTLDELNAYIGLIRDQAIDPHTADVLLEIQDRLFTAESLVACDPELLLQRSLPLLTEEDILLLEREIDAMNEYLPVLSSFVLPGGNSTASITHIARCVCRRAERLSIKLHQVSPIDLLVIKYLNRLSDYLFVLSRKLVHDGGGTETIWKARI